jgi:hypothetical protein
LDFTVAEREEWYTAFVNITYIDPVTSEVRTEKAEYGRYGEHSLKRDAKGVVVLPSLSQDRQACDPGTRFSVPVQGSAWIALIARGNCTFKDKIRHAASQNASAIVIFNVGSSNSNDTITMPHSGMDEQARSSYDVSGHTGWGVVMHRLLVYCDHPGRRRYVYLVSLVCM